MASRNKSIRHFFIFFIFFRNGRIVEEGGMVGGENGREEEGEGDEGD